MYVVCLVAVGVGLVRTFGGDAQVVGLSRGQRGQLHADLFQVQPRYFLIIGCLLLLGDPVLAQAPAVSTTPHPAVEVIKATTPDASQLKARKGSYSFKIESGDWTDTGVPVTPSDHLNFTATGDLALADGRSAPPDGLTRGWKDLVRTYPLNSANSGALIGRIGNEAAAVPFLIGASKDMDVSATGNLFLRLNLSSDLSGTGNVEVKMKLTNQPTQKTVSAPDLAKLLSPQLFADVPRRVGDLQGNPGDMVNYALVGTQDQVTKAFAAAGWVQVDKTTQDAVVHGLISTLSHAAYTEMPMSTLYLFGRSQDLVVRPRGSAGGSCDPAPFAGVEDHQTVGGEPLWVGSATHDNGFEKDRVTVGSRTISTRMSNRSVIFWSRVFREPELSPALLM